MKLSTYESLTGTTVAEADTPRVTAEINRTRSILETLLGFPLCRNEASENLYNELGKTQAECACPSTINTEELSDPDEVQGAYRLFNFSYDDIYLPVDPFSTLYKVKLVYVQPGAGDNGITIKTFDDEILRTVVGRSGWSKYIQRCQTCYCLCECNSCVQLAVDADWLWATEEALPKDLLYLWAEMITYYGDCKKDLKSETVTSHSWTKFDRTVPELQGYNIAILKRYVGPHGSLYQGSLV